MDSLDFRYPQTPGLVSVVMPAWNGDPYIGAALDSIAAQTYPGWEVIVIEDGTTGETEEIVRQFAQRHPHHRVHYQRNDKSYGPSYSRNRAFELTKGQYVALLDCDDRWLPDQLQECLGALTESGYDVAFSASAFCQDGTDYMMGFWGPTPEEMDVFPHSLLGRNYITPSTTVMRREVIEQVGAWNTDLRHAEDLDFCCRAAAIGKRFRCIGGVHTLYRKAHNGALTQAMARTIEVLSTVSEWHIDDLANCHKAGAKQVAASYVAAARMHLNNNPEADPSAKRSRAAALFYKAWLLDRKRTDYLLKAIWFGVTRGWAVIEDLPARPATGAPAVTLPRELQAAA